MFRMAWLAALVAVTGCKMFMTRLTTSFSETPWSAQKAARIDGPECDRVRATREDVLEVTAEGGYYDRAGVYDPDKVQEKDFSPEAQILLAVCKRSVNSQHGYQQWAKVAEQNAFDVYDGFDDRKPDVLSAAITAVHTSNSPRRSDGQGLRESIPVAILWSRVFPPERVQAELARVAVSDAAKAAFMTQYRAIASRLEPVLGAENLPIHVELAVDVYQRRQKHYADFDALYTKYDRLVELARQAGDVPAERDRVVKALEKLRAEFLARCGRAECRALPLHGQITVELAKLHVLRRDVMAARAESSLVSRQGGWVAGLPQAIWIEQVKELRRLDEIAGKYRRARSSGMDERAATELAGGKPVDVKAVVRPGTEIADYSKALEGSRDLRQSSGEVASVQGGGAERKVLFKKKRHDNSIPYDCRRTNRISHIGTDGTISYEEDCKWRDVTDYVETHKPIQLPAAEAAGLRAGDVITFVLDEKRQNRARILEVKRAEKVVQIRADRVR
jgi:hypothetical protein